jgi:preprotein translocase subunit SecB
MRKILQLEDFSLSRLHVDWHEPEGDAKVMVESFLDYDVARHRRDKKRFRVDLRVRIAPPVKGPKVGYEIDSEIVAIFSFPEGVAEDQMQRLVRFNGCFILYGILRGEIASFTGSFPGGKFLLPTVDMEEVVRAVEKRRAERGSIKRAGIYKRKSKA